MSELLINSLDKILNLHDQILSNGNLPVELLEKLTLEWIDKTKVHH